MVTGLSRCCAISGFSTKPDASMSQLRSALRHGGLAAALGLATFATCGAAAAQATATPIKHLIVVFQENVSFDHYFATYPKAQNLPGETPFQAAPGTPSVNGLTAALLEHNPNKANPYRLSPSQAVTCDMDHDYEAEQRAFDGGLMDKFIEFASAYPGQQNCAPNGVMAYFDGNTVTALWNYAQHFAMSDNSFDTQFGPSTPGALNLISGNTHGASPASLFAYEEPAIVEGTVIGDPDPEIDDCSDGKSGLAEMSGRNIGDLLNAKSISWGWFQGGFRPTEIKDGKAVCGAKSANIAGKTVYDYSPHHQPFQYYAHTANRRHLPPNSLEMIGQTDQANHQYDLADFFEVLAKDRLPAVSFIKAKKFQDGHAGYSNPIDEQTFLVDLINKVGASASWADAAIIIAYDDSDGWYDHVMPPIVKSSAVANVDALNGPGRCGNEAAKNYPARCGYGARLPLLVISPYARVNFVDHTTTDQTSILRFIEDNWALGRIGDQSYDELAGSLEAMFDFDHSSASAVQLDPKTGAVMK
jgi:phospholipase C